MATTGSRPPDSVPSKATLFCPSCEYYSDVDGDWDVREYTRYRRIDCPVCETTVTTRRPVPDDRPVGARVEP